MPLTRGRARANRLSDAQLADLNRQRQKKEDAMKLLERELVELLVEQQKKLLGILSQASGAAGKGG